MNYWHYAATPTGPHAHQIDPGAITDYAEREMALDPELERPMAIAEALGLVAEEIRTRLGFPPNGRWVARARWDSGVSPGDPHPSYLDACRAAGHEPGTWPNGVDPSVLDRPKT